MVFKLGEILVNKGLVTSQQLDNALKEQQKTGEFIGSILVRLEYISEQKLLMALSEQLGLRYLSLKDIPIDKEVVRKVPGRLVWRYKFMPLKLKENTLTIALSNPLDVWLAKNIRFYLGYNVETVLCSESEIMDTIKKYYGVGAETIEGILDHEIKTETVEDRIGKLEDIERLAEHASVVKLVNQLLIEAVHNRATDIHIEAYRDGVRVRHRIDGVLYEMPVSPNIKYFHPAIISRVKIISGLDIAERRRPQDGRTKVKVGDKEVDLRISILPAFYGENAVIRILPTQLLYKLDELGFLPDDLKKLQELIERPHGIIFLTGPTGSGKTTTLYACLSRINTSELKIITIEDPVEYELKGVTQIQVNPKINFRFADALRSVLRHDPDVMMVGEVRDMETAELAIRVALTGHLIFSTLHTNDACSGVTRLLDMGIEPYLVASSVEAFIAQRLVRVICPKCKEEVPKNEIPKLWSSFPQDERINKFYRGKGCQVCKFTGHRGRTAIYEIFLVDDRTRDLILGKAPAEQIKEQAVSSGMKTLRKQGWEKVKMGITTLQEVMRVTGMQQ